MFSCKQTNKKSIHFTQFHSLTCVMLSLIFSWRRRGLMELTSAFLKARNNSIFLYSLKLYENLIRAIYFVMPWYRFHDAVNARSSAVSFVNRIQIIVVYCAVTEQGLSFFAIIFAHVQFIFSTLMTFGFEARVMQWMRMVFFHRFLFSITQTYCSLC